MTPEFTAEERSVLARHFSNLDGPVYALTDLPDVTKAALFARYSRSPKSLRRLFLDEFATSGGGGERGGSEEGLARSEALFSRVLADYGDDSVAQLAGVHVALEGISNLATKVVERPRLGAYLEQSTRYIPYDFRDALGRYRYVRPPELEGSEFARFEEEMDALFDAYSSLTARVTDRLFASSGGVESLPPAMRATLRAFALDATRGLLPAATASNVGIFASAQTLEQLVLHLAAHPLGEMRLLGEQLQRELEREIPSMVSRLSRPERREPWVEYLRSTRHALASLARSIVSAHSGIGGAQTIHLDGPLGSQVDLVDWDPDAERRVGAAIVVEALGLGAVEAGELAASIGEAELDALFAQYCGERGNRRHRPGRAFERTRYHFGVVSDYGAFRDLQRHRMLSISWGDLGCEMGYFTSPKLTDDEAAAYASSLERAADYHRSLAESHGAKVASYAVPMAFRIRFDLELNAREAMHLIELRSAPQGHESYREVAQLMYRAIAEGALHRRISGAMSHVDMSAGEGGRLASIERQEQKRSAP
ncbi:MAG: FAD-dependent thymidylate synthase [Actinomycetota bacterium]|nr:FAD-dependent thymidylate synthase [Actinomycetota bacterium]